MVDLPKIQPRGVTTRAPQSSLSAAEIANPFQQIGEALGDWSTVLGAKAQDDARIEGDNAVYRDEQGNVRVDLRPNMSEKNRVYNRSASAALFARKQSDNRVALSNLAIEAKGNPEAFQASARGFRDQTLKNTPPELRGPMTSALDEMISQQHTGIVNQKFQSDMTKAKSAFIEERQFLEDQVASLAFQGGTGTKEYAATIVKIKSLNSELTGNPVFQYDQREADIYLKRLEGRAAAEGMVGMADRAIKKGGLAEGLKFADQIMTDKTLPFSMQERRQYAGLIRQQVAGAAAEQRANQEPLKPETKRIRENFKLGIGIDDPEVQEHMDALARAGAPGEVLKLQHEQEMARRKYTLQHATPEQQTAMAENALGNANRPAPSRSRPANFSPAAAGSMQTAMAHLKARGLTEIQAAGIIGNLMQESGLNPKARNRGDGSDGSDSIGIAQWNGDRARALQDFAASKGVSADDLGTQLDFLLSELQTKEGAAYQRLLAAKNVDEATAAIIGFERPQGWSADNPRGGHGWSNRLAAASKAAELAGVDPKLIAVSRDTSIDPEEAKAYREVLGERVKESWPDIEAGIRNGTAISEHQLGLLTRQLAIINDPELNKKTADLLEANKIVATFSDAPPEVMQAAIDSLRSDMSAQGASALQADMLQGLEASQRANDEARKNDPLGLGLHRGWIKELPTLNLDQADTWATTFSKLQRGVDVMQASREVTNIPALRPAMQQQLHEFLANSSPLEQLRLLGTMEANLAPDTYMATLSAISAKGESSTTAAAGALVAYNPVVAQGVLRGQALLRQNPNLAPKNSAADKVAVDEILPLSVFVSGLEGARQQILNAATARYADLSNQVGDTSGELNDTRMEQAVAEVTGGLVEMNGYQVISPRYGASQDDFDRLLNSLTDRDLENAVTADGTPVRARDLLNEGRLRAVAAGRYVLEFGNEDHPTYALQRPSAGNYGQPSSFVLDLRVR